MAETPIVYNLDSGSSGGNGGCGNGMWGGDGSWIFAFLIIALIFGDRWGLGGNNGNGGGNSVPAYIPYPISSFGGFNASGALTRADLCQDMNFQEVKNGVAGVSDAVALGFSNLNSTICQQQYDTAQMVNGLNTTLLQGFNGANVVALQNQNALQTQLAQCCCENREGQAQIRYDMATNTCALQNTLATSTRDVIDSQNAGTRAILDKMCQMEYNALNDKYQAALTENQSLKFAASQAQQNVALGAMMDANTAEIIRRTAPQTPVPAFPVNPPFPYYGYGFGAGFGGSSCGNSCSCNTGCGC